ncbi:hypothetical protein AWV80_07320 [Cupriavidus sp. UYMU48A]|nr:hypothetical protein AWV80_07320 [Cupriavidus sp. UYMU48A]
MPADGPLGIRHKGGDQHWLAPDCIGAGGGRILGLLMSIAGIKEPGIFGVMEPGGAAWFRLERGLKNGGFFLLFQWWI